jgi:hypothetical protein
MDKGRHSISAQALYTRFGNATAPLIVDVRREPAFAGAGQVICGATRCLPEAIDEWFKTGTLQTLLACSAAGLLLHFVGVVG